MSIKEIKCLDISCDGHCGAKVRVEEPAQVSVMPDGWAELRLTDAAAKAIGAGKATLHLCPECLAWASECQRIARKALGRK